MKICSKCNLEKDFSEFSKHKKMKDGLYSLCKMCKSANAKKYYRNNREKIIAAVGEHRAKNIDKVSQRVKTYYLNNREELIEYKKKYYLENKERLTELNKEYNITNREKVNENKKIYIRKKRLDPLFKFNDRICGLIRASIKRMGYTKRSRAENILGCTYIEFRNHIENIFLEGMTWENHGQWHLDHIIPISWGKTEEEIVKLNHYTNFQPLWMKDNLSKGNRFEG